MPVNHEPTRGVTVIGGGIIGAFSAYYLRRSGWPVTLIEQGQFGHGSSHGNCGLIVPGHILPLNNWKNLACGLKWIRERSAPLRIAPRPNPRLIAWLFCFAANCRPGSIRRATGALAPLMRNGTDDYRSLVDRHGLDCDWEQSGALHLFMGQRACDAYQRIAAVMASYGMGARALTCGQAAQMEPAVSPHRTAGAWFDPHTARLRPDRLMNALKDLLAENGVAIVAPVRATGFVVERGRAVAVTTDSGPIRADAFVVAAGAWTPQLGRSLGYPIPIQPGKGYSVTFDPLPSGPAIPCFFEETRVVATPWPSGLRLGGTLEFAGYDDRLNPARISPLLRAAARYLTPMTLSGNRDAWCGWRPMTPDSVPIIDWSPRMENVLIAAGHNMLGLTMAPATGRLVAELVGGDPPHVDPAPYRLRRFFA